VRTRRLFRCGFALVVAVVVACVSIGFPMAQAATKQQINAKAATYDRFIKDTEAMARLDLGDSRTAQRLRTTLRKYDPQTLGAAYVAYLARAGGKVAAFRQGLESALKQGKPDELAAQWKRQPGAVMKIGGATQALSAIQNAAKAEQRRLQRLAQAYAKAADALKANERKKGALPPSAGPRTTALATLTVPDLTEGVTALFAAVFGIRAAQAAPVKKGTLLRVIVGVFVPTYVVVRGLEDIGEEAEAEAEAAGVSCQDQVQNELDACLDGSHNAYETAICYADYYQGSAGCALVSE
jgi:hypothetical protein